MLPAIAAIHKRLCATLHLDRSSVLRISLYTLLLYLDKLPAIPRTVHHLIAQLEHHRAPSSPTWVEFACGQQRTEKETGKEDST